jgi:uncharacterized protein YjhX (UPF0386 family)
VQRTAILVAKGGKIKIERAAYRNIECNTTVWRTFKTRKKLSPTNIAVRCTLTFYPNAPKTL